jgi:hypothetical protein
MAYGEHLKILKQGVDVWNQWRMDNPEIKPDFSEVNLSKADLSEADSQFVTPLNLTTLSIALLPP